MGDMNHAKNIWKLNKLYVSVFVYITTPMKKTSVLYHLHRVLIFSFSQSFMSRGIGLPLWPKQSKFTLQINRCLTYFFFFLQF